jgi:hypothetical protein
MGDKKYLWNTEYNFEREKWFEAIKNCRRTVKEIKNSISQKPKNVGYLVELYEKEGEKAVEKIAEKKKDEIFKRLGAMAMYVLIYNFFYSI